jgi:predicted nuclease with RNAse H fold
MGLEGDLKIRTLTSHEIDAVTAALTGHLYIEGKTELIGDEKEGYIIVPSKRDWRKLRL